jgi:hypothetical protein
VCSDAPISYRKQDKAIGMAFKILEKNFPKHAKNLNRLKSFYNWVTTPEAEFDLLKTIMKTI